MGTGYWVLGTGYWVLGTGYWVLGTGYWVLGTGYWVLGTGYWVLGTGYWVLPRYTRYLGTQRRHLDSSEGARQGMSLLVIFSFAVIMMQQRLPICYKMACSPGNRWTSSLLHSCRTRPSRPSTRTPCLHVYLPCVMYHCVPSDGRFTTTFHNHHRIVRSELHAQLR